MDTGCKTGAYIGDTIANKDCITHINAQFITRPQQHARAGLATGAILFLTMWTEIYLLYLTSNITNTALHPAMNIINRFHRDASARYTRLVSTHDNAMTSLR